MSDPGLGIHSALFGTRDKGQKPIPLPNLKETSHLKRGKKSCYTKVGFVI